MENFNKNWLIILLIAFVFLILGFLLGRVTGHRHQRWEGRKMEKMMLHNGHGERMMHLKEGGANVTIKIDTVLNAGKEVEVKVEKKPKK